jgi:orotidine-5'-phosphate decarboxylase
MNRPLPVVLAVTILTSLDDADLDILGFRYGSDEMVVRLATLAAEAGMGGVVCSPRDIDSVRRPVAPISSS